MKIQDWGAIGEVIGAAAVVITLAYLATQIRHQNLQFLRTSMAREHSREWWRGNRGMYAPRFAAAMDEIVAKLEAGEGGGAAGPR